MGIEVAVAALLQIVSVAAAAVAVAVAVAVTEHAVDFAAEHVAGAGTVDDFVVATEPKLEKNKVN